MSFLGLFDEEEVPPAPDYSPIIAGLQSQAAYANQLSREQLDFFKRAYTENKGITDAVAKRFMEAQDDNLANARKDRARYEQTFQPVEDRFVEDARTWDSGENLEQARGRAMGRTGAAFDAARQNAIRDLEGYGIKPGTLRMAGLDRGAQLARAAASSAAGEQAEAQRRAEAVGLRGQAINMGARLPGQAAGEYGVANSSGAGAGNTSLAQTASAANTMGTPTQWFTGGTGAIKGAGDVMHQGYQDQMAEYKAKQGSSSGIGTLAGIAGGAIGAYFGGPAGAMAGYSLGSGLGGAVDGSGMSDGEYAEGGEVDEVQDDASNDFMGPVTPGMSPSGGRAIDDVQAHGTAGAIRVDEGEFIFPEDVSKYYGTKFLYGMIDKAHQAMYGEEGSSPKSSKSKSKQQAIPITGRQGLRALPLE